LLVALKTSVQGSISYERNVLEQTEKLLHTETKRRMANPKEHAEAIRIRARVRSLVRSVCATTAFGFFCLLDKQGELDGVVAQAEALVEAFNEKATHTSIWFGIMRGKVLANDLEAVRGINNEVRELLNQMSIGIKSSDAEEIRDAADRAKQVASVLATEAQQLVEEAIEAARKAASGISKAQRKNEEIDPAATKAALQTIKKSFLDFDMPAAQPVKAAKAKRTLDIEESARGL
jgi:hypothetical protein